MIAFVGLSMLSAMRAFFSSGLLSPVAIVASDKAGTLTLSWVMIWRLRNVSREGR